MTTYTIDRYNKFELYRIDEDLDMPWLSKVNMNSFIDIYQLWSHTVEMHIMGPKYNDEMQEFMNQYYSHINNNETNSVTKWRTWNSLFGEDIIPDAKLWSNFETVRRYRNDFNNIKQTMPYYNTVRNTIKKKDPNTFITAKYMISPNVNEPRSMLILAVVIDNTIVIRYILALANGWIYQNEQIADEITNTYYRDSAIGLFLWTLEEIKKLYPNVTQGAISAITKGSKQLMKALQQHGYSALEYDDIHDEESKFTFPVEDEGSLSFSSEEEEKGTKRKQIGFVFSLCQICGKPPKYTCGHIKCCSKKCAKKYWLE